MHLIIICSSLFLKTGILGHLFKVDTCWNFILRLKWTERGQKKHKVDQSKVLMVPDGLKTKNQA